MKRILSVMLIGIMIISMAGCQQADKVSQNLSKEADNFNVIRKITVINCITGDVLFEMQGRISIETDSVDSKLDIIVEHERGLYRKHYIGLNMHTAYVVEDIGGADVDNYKYTLNYNPKLWIPVGFDNID